MNRENYLKVRFPALPENERIARMIAASFLASMNPTIEEMDDVKTAVSEAVTNGIIHAYDKERREKEEIVMTCYRTEDMLQVEITDTGKGIADIKKAMEPLYTTCTSGERSGMGFAFMEAFMDEIMVDSVLQEGTTVLMKKKIGNSQKLG